MIPLRLVIDTNILVSAALKPDGLQRTVLVLAMTKPARLYVTKAILAEYREVLARPEFKIRRGLRQQLLQLIKNHSQLVNPARALLVAKDPDDNQFLECADAARADYLITGNQRHFPKFWKQTKVITSREFISIVAPHFIQ
ncbi:MAG: putative toxin-antitoxin system toxin component, PIN family [Acidobacteriales bacterium]|nr:putative toxin-antitoxin system toxin component, PIN family [Candidatus Koribacter versatilis]MBI3644874.1 putative toxin-antitoxin system toxin component, PIN family [Terriglobales bacterium]